MTKTKQNNKSTSALRKKGFIRRALTKIVEKGHQAARRVGRAGKRLVAMARAAARRVGRVGKRVTVAAARRVGRVGKRVTVVVAQKAKLAAQYVGSMAHRVIVWTAEALEPIRKVLAVPYRAAANAAAYVSDSPLGDLTRGAWGHVKTGWGKVVGPFLKNWGIIFGFDLWLSSMAVAPAATMLVTSVAGLLVLAMSKGVAWLEKSPSRFARIVLGTLEGLAQVLRVAFYVGSGVLVMVLAMVSMPLALVFMVDMVLRTMDWVLRHRSVFVRDGARAEAQEHAPSIEVIAVTDVMAAMAAKAAKAAPQGTFLRAKGTEELWGGPLDMMPAAVAAEAAEAAEAAKAVVGLKATPMAACAACGSVAGKMRINALCPACYESACEEDALRMTGTSLDARCVEVRLNRVGVEAAPEYAASCKDTDSLHWMVAGWWRDTNGDTFPREWSCLHGGTVVATVVYDHQRAVYHGTCMGKLVPNGVKHNLDAAKLAAVDELMDEAGRVSRLVQTLGAAFAPPVLVAAKAG